MDGILVVDEARTGRVNMHADERLLAHVQSSGKWVLRLYRWSQPTLSLGYFQTYASRNDHLASRTLDVVRRATGGGAIVHDKEWTYSLAMPSTSFQNGRQKSISAMGAATTVYDWVHDEVVSSLRQRGFEARKWSEEDLAHGCQTDASGEKRGCAFLCFERRSPGDVVVSRSKVMGSAQRRSHGALLQHGSLLLDKSPYAPSLDGINQLSPKMAKLQRDLSSGKQSTEFDSEKLLSEFAERLATVVAANLGGSWNQVDRLQDIPDFAWANSDFSGGRYGEEGWTQKR